MGTDEGPTPVEFLLHGLAACITAGPANIAAARGVTLTEVTSSIEGDAPAEKLREIVEQSRSRSAVYDVLTNGVPVEVAVNAA